MKRLWGDLALMQEETKSHKKDIQMAKVAKEYAKKTNDAFYQDTWTTTTKALYMQYKMDPNNENKKRILIEAVFNEMHPDYNSWPDVITAENCPDSLRLPPDALKEIESGNLPDIGIDPITCRPIK